MNINTLIIEKTKENLIDYNKIKKENVFVLYNKEKYYDFNVIIPIRGRVGFLEKTFKSFKKSENKNNIKVCYTVVEHSIMPENSKVCKENNINYIWIKSNENDLFNKCLAHNVGAFFSNKSKYLLFHDVDCLVQSDFFENLLKNIKDKNAKSIQNFTDRRVLYLNDKITEEVLNEKIDFDELSIENENINLPKIFGAPGGSITIERDLFFKVGGYDPELFLANSPEDIFFWNKVEVYEKMEVCDNPKIEIYHMYHKPTYNDNPKLKEMLVYNNIFKNFTNDVKEIFVVLKRNLIKEFNK